MEKSFWVWTAALEAGYLPIERLEQWIDAQLLVLESPPKWMIEVSLATSVQESVASLASAWVRDVEAHGTDFRAGLWGPLHLGFLFLCFERGDLELPDLLSRAGQISDSLRCGINCEAFFLLLNELEGSDHPDPGSKPLRERVADRFAPFATKARQQLGSLPFLCG